MVDSKAKIDPSKIPRPPLFTRPQDSDDQETSATEASSASSIPIYYPKEALHHETIRPPPPADSRFVTWDDGNAAPQLIRSTIYAIPLERNILRKSLNSSDSGASDGSMALLCTPLAIASEDHVPRKRKLVMSSSSKSNGNNKDDDDEEEWRDAQRIPVINVETTSPPRCHRCHAYANPFWTRRGECNFCRAQNQRSSNNIPIMTTQFGTVEYQVGGPYITRSIAGNGMLPVQPICLYALDATCPNLPSYIAMIFEVGTSMAQHHLRQHQDGLADNGEQSTMSPRIGCCLVGSFGVVTVHFDKGGVIALSVMSDVTEEPFAPLPLEMWTFDMATEDGVAQWKCLTDQLWDAWQPF